MRSPNSLTILGSIFLFFVGFCLPGADSLEAIQVAPLPAALGRISPFYDGSSDKIYLFGGDGSNSYHNQDILSFDLMNNAIQSVGKISPNLSRAFGSMPVFPSSNGTEIFYLVSILEQNSTVIFKFDPADGSSHQIGEIPIHIGISGFTKAPNGNYYIFGGEDIRTVIFKMNLESEIVDSEAVGTIHEYFQFAVSATVNNTAFIFGTDEGINFPYNNIALNLDTLESSNLKEKLDTYYGVPSVTATNRNEVFLIGGFSGGMQYGIVRIDAITQDVEFLPVDNFPLLPVAHYYIAPATVYVEKLNRVYFFGGIQMINFMSSVYVDHVWYIDL